MKNRTIVFSIIIIFVLLLFIALNNRGYFQENETLKSNNESSNNNEESIDTPDSKEKELYELFYSENRENHRNEIIILLKEINYNEYIKATKKDPIEILEWIKSFESYDEEQIAGIINLATSVDGAAAEMLSIITYKAFSQDMLYFVDVLSRYNDNEKLIEDNSFMIFSYAFLRDFEDKVIEETKTLLKNEELPPVQKEIIEKMVTYMEKYKKINTFE